MNEDDINRKMVSLMLATFAVSGLAAIMAVISVMV